MSSKHLTFLDSHLQQPYRTAEHQASIDNTLTWVKGQFPEVYAEYLHKEAEFAKTTERIRKSPLRPEMLAALNAVREKIKTSIKPLLANEYTLLGLERGASKRDIKNAYRRKARKLHPDKGGDEASMKQLNAAYKRLLEVVK